MLDMLWESGSQGLSQPMGEEEGEPKTAEFERVAASNMESRLSAVKHSSVVSSSSFEFETGLVSLVLAQLPEESGASLRLERRAPRRRMARFGSELLRVVPCCCCCCCWLGSWGRVMVFANGGCCCWCWCCAGDEEGALALLLQSLLSQVQCIVWLLWMKQALVLAVPLGDAGDALEGQATMLVFGAGLKADIMVAGCWLLVAGGGKRLRRKMNTVLIRSHKATLTVALCQVQQTGCACVRVAQCRWKEAWE